MSLTMKGLFRAIAAAFSSAATAQAFAGIFSEHLNSFDMITTMTNSFASPRFGHIHRLHNP